MNLYVTYNDSPSPIYSSQVVDVVKFINSNLKKPITLFAIVSLRNYFKSKKIIHQQLPDAWVIPMFPYVVLWQLNVIICFFLFLYIKPKVIISRSVLATLIAQYASRNYTKIIYDGRGAITAEWNEYNVVTSKYLLKKINNWEKSAVIKSHKRISISNALIDYWKEAFSYSSNAHVIIPCTLNSFYTSLNLKEDTIEANRKNMGYSSKDIVFIYSGSNAKWQSFNILNTAITGLLKISINNKFLFLGNSNPFILSLMYAYPNQVNQFCVSEQEIPNLLMCGDYGLLLREESVTNKVASPIKFAEYLACGLGIIITPNIGDYSSYVINNNCGYLWNTLPLLNRPDSFYKKRLNALAVNDYSKLNFINSFSHVLK